MTPSPRSNTHPRRASLALLALAVAAVGCSSGERSKDASQGGAAPPSPEKVDLCVLMPPADVAATLQAHGEGTVNQHKAGAGGM